jgi:hypothetical protein
MAISSAYLSKMKNRNILLYNLILEIFSGY